MKKNYIAPNLMMVQLNTQSMIALSVQDESVKASPSYETLSKSRIVNFAEELIYDEDIDIDED